MPHPLDTFFAPDSIALIGASRDLEKIPGRLLSMLRKNGFAGKIYPINPNYGDIDGLKCYPSIAEGRAGTGCEQTADRHCRAKRRHRLCDLSPRQGAGYRAQLRHQRRQ